MAHEGGSDMKVVCSLIAGLVVLASAARAQPAGEGVYVPAAKIASSVAKTKDGLASAPVATGPGTTIVAAHRDADGQVEVHKALNDEFVVLSGHATVLVGGMVEGSQETAPGEWRGGRISGAKAYAMGPGDVLWIPAGAPHKSLVPKGGDFRYLAFKFAAKPAP
jgi:mannose-6-phosphate isomerase-like protein (cupin superfamily)